MNGTDEVVRLEVVDAVATVTLNRPDRLNVLDAALARALKAALEDVERRDDVRAVILTGAGDHFMAGGDVRWLATLKDETPEARHRTVTPLVAAANEIPAALRRMRQPVVAAVRGAAAGFGLSLVMACDLAVAADSAYFTLAYRNIGITPDGGSSFFLPRLVGPKRAAEIALLGDRFDARTALEMGLLNRVVAPDALGPEVQALARRLADGPSAVLAATKALLNQGMEGDLAGQLARETRAFAQAAAGRDFVEGVDAFLGKRKPSFTGR